MTTMHDAKGPRSEAGVGQITLRYWAGARQAAGVEADVIEAEAPFTVTQAREQALALHPDREPLERVLAVCSILVDDRPLGADDPDSVLVPMGSTVEFLPPFAGG